MLYTATLVQSGPI